MRIKLNIIQIIMQVFSHPAISGITSRTELGSTLTPVTNSADILTRRICQKHICTLILALCYAFEPASRFRKSSQVCCILHSNQEINIFWVRVGAEERAEHCDTPYTRQPNDPLNKPKRFGDKKYSKIFVNRWHLTHFQVYCMAARKVGPA
jgi:hypothetical protein